jgi:hypothetical protein
MTTANTTEDKAFSTVRAQLALRGVMLRRTDGEGGRVVYIAQDSRSPVWARTMNSLAEVEAFARQVGAVG